MEENIADAVQCNSLLSDPYVYECCPIPERREEEGVGAIRGREGMVAVNSMIQNNI